MMRYCKKCVQPDTRPNIYFNDEGVCGACLWEKEREKIDWDKREKELAGIAEWAIKTTKTAYDCVIGVSGGKDSTFQALYARDRLGLRPLLVNAEPMSITDVGRHNIENLKCLGFDIITIRPNPVLGRKLAKIAFNKFLHNGRFAELYLYSSAYIIADKFDIPLIIQGENASLTLGVRKEQGLGDDALKVQKLNTLSSGLKPFLDEGIDERELFLYTFDAKQIEKKGIKAIWLNYYAKEWSQYKNAVFSLKNGLKLRPRNSDPHSMGIYSRYYQIDSDTVHVNQMLKYIKFGFGQCTDHACYDIREGRITREEGIALIKEFDGLCSEELILEYCNYINIDLNEFWRVVDSYRGPMWEKNTYGSWELKGAIYEKEKEYEKVDISNILERERKMEQLVAAEKY